MVPSVGLQVVVVTIGRRVPLLVTAIQIGRIEMRRSRFSKCDNTILCAQHVCARVCTIQSMYFVRRDSRLDAFQLDTQSDTDASLTHLLGFVRASPCSQPRKSLMRVFICDAS
jgi:hypothetical protein